jgi:hypothetical protein
MSNSIAAAKKRRAGIQPSTPQVPNSFQSQNVETNSINSPKLTLPQVITVIDNRLINLEQFMREFKENNIQSEDNIVDSNNIELTTGDSDEIIKVPIAEYVVEMDKKFELLVEEITTLKDIVLKLQSFTMEVNKTLMEDRIQILSDYKNIEIDNTTQSENIYLNTETVEISQTLGDK